MMVDSQITANVRGEGNGIQNAGTGEGIDIQVNQDVVIQDGAFLETNVTEEAAPGIGSGGVYVKADRIEILDTAPNFTLTGIRSSVAPGSEGGSSGDVLLEANSILVKGAFLPFFTGNRNKYHLCQKAT